MKAPLLSEKAYKLMEKGVYTFLVDKTLNKNDVAKFVENHFAVKVKKVNIFAQSAKPKRIGRTRKMTQIARDKKAIVYLEKGQSISRLMPKTESKKTSKTKGLNEPKSESQKKGFLSKIRKQNKNQKEKSK